MRKFVLFIFLFLCNIHCIQSAQRHTRDGGIEICQNSEENNARLDSVIQFINQSLQNQRESGYGNILAKVYVKGESHCLKSKRLAKLIPNVLPFETTSTPSHFEAICQIKYRTPSNLQVTPLAYRGSSKKSNKCLRELYQIIMPIHSVTQSKNKDKRFYIIPFSKDGLKHYTYTLVNSETAANDSIWCIRFTPSSRHHLLLDGYTWINMNQKTMTKISCSGKIDFGTFSMVMDLCNFDGKVVIKESNIAIHYNYAGNLAENYYRCNYYYEDYKTLNEFNTISQEAQYDLTDVLSVTPLDSVNWEEFRGQPISSYEDSVMSKSSQAITTQTAKKLLNAYKRIPERLVSSSNFDVLGTKFKVYGPLDPASLGYNKLNGFTIRERFRLSHVFRDGRSVLIRPEIGYCFGIQEWRYKVNADWIYYPQRRGGLKLQVENTNSGFSSKYIEMVNETMKLNGGKFEDLGLHYYHLDRVQLENAFEIGHGLMCYVGSSLNYRTPANFTKVPLFEEDPSLDSYNPQAPDDNKVLIKNHYIDFTPYIRLTWTPKQYYYYQNKNKLYIDSHYPTFSLEIAKGVKRVFGSTSDFERAEFDVEQIINLDEFRKLSLHAGIGAFFNQKGEYFVNYKYFARSQYPDSWSDNIGGVFNLLDDYWYSSSPRYIQAHAMFESPFIFLSHIRSIARYVIKERLYLSTLLAEGKTPYEEIGYGIGNNYFNIGLFTGFIGFDYMDFGLKFSIEIDQHW